jgi:glycosyl transferase family 1
MNLFLWHVHGSWTTAFVQGQHRYYVPVLPDRGSNGRGRAESWVWPDSVEEVTPAEAADLDLDVVILQRPRELLLAESWLRRRVGTDLPAVYLEHDAPQGRINDLRHPMAGRSDVTIAHVTHFNHLFWDCAGTRSVVIEHGIVDPGHRYRGHLPHGAVVVNDARRRNRVIGLDLVNRFAKLAKVDLFGRDAAALGGHENLPQDRLHDALADRRVYLHLTRWTSLGLSLIEAMHLGMPVVALATTETPEAVPPGTGIVSTRVDVLESAFQRLLADPDEARERGLVARQEALRRYGLERFLTDWDQLLAEVAR